MWIEQYFLMTDYSLWEVILNGDSPVSTRIVKGVVQPVAPTTAKQRLARKNKLKARDSLVPTRVVEGVLQPVAPTTAEQKLARKNELKARGITTQNLAFVSSSNTDSTTESVSVAASVSTVCAKMPGEKNKKRTKSEQNRTKTGNVEKPGNVKGQSQSRKQKRKENTDSRDQKWKP
nr:hypothetical protein [Tanacetum cinerariifolium]